MADSPTVAWIAAGASVVAALIAGYFAYEQKELETETKAKEIALQQSPFEAQERRRFEDVLAGIVPKLVSGTTDTVRVGRATLFVIYPDRAGEVMEAISAALTEQQRASVRSLLVAAETLQARSTGWFVIAGGTQDADRGARLLERASSAGFGAILYHRANWYRVGIGPYPQRTDAESAKIAVSATLNNTAYVVLLQRWCPTRVRHDKYVECTGSDANPSVP